MKQIFRISPNYAECEKKYDLHIDAEHKYGLPGVNCSVCSATWGSAAVAYPNVDPSLLMSQKEVSEYLGGWPVDLEELERLRHPIMQVIPNTHLPPPGSQFGCLVGTAKGFYGDFAWVGLWTLLIQQDTLNTLQKYGVKGLTGTRPCWISSSKSADGLVELFAEPSLEIHPQLINMPDVHRCPACSRLDIKWSDPMVVSSPIPEKSDIFRGKDMSTSLFVTETFVKAVQDIGINCLLFEPIQNIGFSKLYSKPS